MNPERSPIDPASWARIEELFLEARALPATERHAHLARRCGDAALRREIESLLAADRDAAGILDTPALQGAFRLPATTNAAAELRDGAGDDALIGARLGDYRILRRIGAGGMGTVMLAERADDAYRKQVAVKIIKRGMDTDEVVRRFNAERRLLARLEHPNIARLIDAGATPDGRPFLVMEHIDGEAIDVHCSRRALPYSAILRLFQAACAAVEHAHRNLIVHRDLKPGNILVTADGTVKLLDFGIAKALAGDDDDGAMTQTHARVLTPRYGSPEQVRGEPVTTASDVYSLGVILYELLAGRGPYDIRTPTRSDYERAITEHTPRPPSAVAAADAPPHRPVKRRWPADLDAIVLMALRKEPHRRYASVAQFAEDLERLEKQLPVRAGPDSPGYRAAKFLRRHAVAAAAAMLVFAGLATALTVSTIWYRRAEAARRAALAAEIEAESHRATAEEINAFLVDMLGAANPNKARGRDLGLLRNVLDSAAAGIADRFKDRPVVEAALRIVIGDTYRRLGLYDAALPHIQAAADLRRAHFGPDHAETLTAEDHLGMIHFDRGDFAAAEPLLRATLENRRRVLGADDMATLLSLNNLGEYFEARSDYAAAAPLFGEALERRRRVLGPEHPDTLLTLNNFAGAKVRSGAFAEAISLLREALELQRRRLGDDHHDTLVGMNDLAFALQKLGRRDEAEPLLREATERMTRIFGPGNMDTLMTGFNYARLLGETGRVEEAEQRVRAILAAAEASLPAGHYLRPFLQGSYGQLLARLDRTHEAVAHLRQAVAGLRECMGDDHPYTRTMRDSLAKLEPASGAADATAKQSD